MKRIYIIATLSLITIIGYTQTPGYVGRRLFLSFNTGPNILFGVGSDFTNAGDKMRVKFHYGGAIDYVYNRYNCVGIKYTYFDRDLEIPRFGVDYDGVNVAGTYPAKLNANQILVRWTHYIKHVNDDLPAPLGIFWGLGIGAGLPTLKYNEKKFWVAPNKLNTNTSEGYAYTDITTFAGVKHAIGNRVLLSFIFELNLSYLGYIVRDNPNSETFLNKNWMYDSDDPVKFQKSENKRMALSGYYNSNVVSFSLELSFLAR